VTKIVDPKKDPRRCCRNVADWPERDSRAWEQAFVPGDVLDPGGPGAHWSPYTKDKVAKGYGRFLTWLDLSGLLTPKTLPEDRVTPEHVAAYVEHLQGLNASQTVLTRIEELTLAMQVMAPRYDRSYLRGIQSVLRAQVTPARDVRARIRHAGELRELGFTLMQAARDSTSTPLRKAIDYRDGLMILFLIHVPLRRKNMTAIRIDDHFVEHGDELWLDIRDDDIRTRTKNNKPIERPLSGELRDCLEEYLAVHRPHLLNQRGRWHKHPGDALWVSKDGSPLTEIAFYFRIKKRTEAAFGRSVNPHLFRHSAVTTIAIERPEQVQMASAVLDHKLPPTTERHYNLAQTIDAANRYQEELAKLHRRLRRK